MKRQQKKKSSYRNNSERAVGKLLKSKGIRFDYESITLSYQLPPSKYLPDFVFEKARQIWEVKGRFVLDDRRKHIALKTTIQYPFAHWKIKFIFLRPNTKLYKKGKMTYGGWCEKYGFEYCSIKDIPKHWWEEVK